MADNPRQTALLALILALAVGYIGYAGLPDLGISGATALRARADSVQTELTKVEAQTDTAKRDLAHGSVDALRKKVDVYRGTLEVLRQFVPEGNEVPNLLDDISSRAKVRGVNLSEVVPQPVEPGPAPFDTYAYNMSVIGRYDQVSEFLTDIASLKRIIVPFQVKLSAAVLQEAKALGDTSGAMLSAKFQIRTFVKSPAAGGTPSGN